MAAAAAAAGMAAHFWENPGSSHDWITASTGLAHVMPWIAQRTGLTA
jgi:S-formylglutathione hydrolase FrmB